MAKRRGRRARERAGGASETRPEGEDRSGAGGLPRIPLWVPVVVFSGLTLVLFRRFVFSSQMLYGGDTLGLGYVSRAFYADALTRLGTFPRWNPEILGGTPFLEALSGGDSLYPPSLLLLLLMEPYRALGWKLVLHIALAGFLMFGWVRALGASRSAALVSGVAYMLAPYLVSLVHPGHDGRIFVTALTPLLFWAVERHFVRPRVQSFAAIALVVGAIILTTHFQMAYFLFGAVGLYALFRAAELWRRPREEDEEEAPRRGRVAGVRFALFLAASLAGAGVGAVQLLPAVDYVTQYSRRTQTTEEAAGLSGVAWSSSWSMHPEEAMGLLIPEFEGNNAGGSAGWAQGLYWGRNEFKDNHEAAGLVVLLLAAVAFVGGRRRSTRFFFAGLAGIAFLFALGAHTPVWRVFYEVVPGIRLFRAPAQVMFLFAFAAATLAALGLDRLLALAEAPDEGRGVMRVLVAGTVGLAALALLASSGILTSFWTAAVNTDLDPARMQRLTALEPFITRGAWIGFFLALATTGVSWALRAGYVAPLAAVAGIGLLVVADELRVSDTFVQVIDFAQWAAPDPNMQTVLRREEGSGEPWRMLSLRQNGQDVRPALFGIELAGGHHPNDLARYRELIGMTGSGLPMNLLESADIRRLLNIRYILWPDIQFGSLEGPVMSRTETPDGRPYESILAEDGLPRARLVGAAVVQPDDRAVDYMLSAAFDPEREVVLPEPPPIALDGQPAAGTVTWVTRSPNELTLAVTSERPALLVVADNWFPAWHATVDDVDTPVLRAYHTLRAVPLEAGEHTVDMYYHSADVTRSLWISVLLLVGLTTAAGWATWRGRRPRRAS